ncbi:MAG: ATP-dependent RNA helicase HrpA [Solirubrobacteraceae bacterium]
MRTRSRPELVERRRAAALRIAYPAELPVSGRRDELRAAIRDHQVVVVAGETGSGKTTQLPKLCLELGRGLEGMIAHTQPRRLAARTVAERIASELGTELGGAVGYAVRFTDRSRPETRLRLMTDGLLVAEIQRDRMLRRYDTVIVDEAHERSLNIDFLLGHLARILPKRPDLKLIITSATIDPHRFARHFGEDVPVVEVSGRTHPVEVRHRPVEDAEDSDRDQTDAIGDAVEELLREPPGDVLVFLSGEREIRDTAEALAGRLPQDVELLPLYARLSTREQQRVFKPSGARRVVLATNVAETSLTVPGIRYVVDPGFARISRYSARLKVQRLPIEKISQASANQRKGRCGRVADGICIRLYTEEDFDERPEFTDPEILRTSLASVILAMAAAGLGDVEDFPFLDPPDRRQVRDGVLLLQELAALDEKDKLTQLGRRLAQLPVDPRLGRMILAAERRHCAEEVIVIAAALSIQDPRERPADKQAQADQLHARFADEFSDFLSLLNLWRYVRESQLQLSSNQFRKRCHAEFLHHLRVREWQDLVGQIRQAAKGVKLELNQTPGESPEIHTALLAGLLSHVGLKDPVRREYAGARGARFMLFPGSVIARKPPTWVMVAELVETSRLWGRTAARIDPRWIEPLAPHLIKRTYDAPRWERKRASVVATERVTLYGLPIVAGRAVAYGRIDPELSRELFIRRALVEGDWDTRHAFFHANRELLEEVGELEHRARRRDIVADDRALYDFYAARVPAEVVSGAHFDRWWRDAKRADPGLLTFTPEDVVDAEAAAFLDPRARPQQWKQGDLTLPLSYMFDPGSPRDGVTVHVPLKVLPQLKAAGFDWLVPALRPELITALIRSLPKELRRALVPVPETAQALHDHVTPRSGPLLDVLARGLEEIRGVRVPRGAWSLDALPPHLRMTFRVEDDQGRLVAEGNDLAALRDAVRPKLRAALSAAAAPLEASGLTDWTVGALPRTVALPGTGQAVRGYPALVDEGATVAVRVLDSPEAQAAAMAAGTRKLIALNVPSPLRSVQGTLGNRELLTLAGAPHPGVREVLDDCVVAALDALIAQGGGPAWDEAGFRRLRDHVAGALVTTTEQVVARVLAILDAARALEAQLDAISAPQLVPARDDVREQLARLVHPGFVAEAGARRLADVERYLAAASRRLERLPAAPAPDRDKMGGVRELEALWEARGRPEEARWLLEELRVSHFAQALGVRGQVSAKKIRQLLQG